ncbi:MAG: s-methyl-5-thioribose-1-phosphate isomerase, partial [Alphaproteobacteria bacterium]
QTRLPWQVEWLRLTDEDQVAHAIRSMQVRGAPLIGAVAAYGLALAMRRDPAALEPVAAMLGETRPTAINLRWALEKMLAVLRQLPLAARHAAAYAEAAAICDDDAATCEAIGRHGLPLLQDIAARKPGKRVNILTHCNAGWIATVDWGTALAPIYMAHDAGIPVHVWVDETRPTAINLRWALEKMLAVLRPLPLAAREAAAYGEAAAICDDDAATCEAIGRHGLPLLQEIAARKPGKRVNILTHCNAGWIATVDWGTALAPIYMAHDAGIPVHVWVDETRPRNQGAALTAWELGAHGVPHTVIADNAGGHLMQHGEVDIVIVGTDRVTRRGDVANKIGTYRKALAAQDNG